VATRARPSHLYLRPKSLIDHNAEDQHTQLSARFGEQLLGLAESLADRKPLRARLFANAAITAIFDSLQEPRIALSTLRPFPPDDSFLMVQKLKDTRDVDAFLAWQAIPTAVITHRHFLMGKVL